MTDDEISEITGTDVTTDNQEALYQEAGYTTDDQIGKMGIEKEYESYLHGECGSKTITVSANTIIIHKLSIFLNFIIDSIIY